jgi:hypothetical protein
LEEYKSKVVLVVSDKDLSSLAWGLVIVLIAVGGLAARYYQISTVAYIALGVGLILIGLNLARGYMGIGVSWFTQTIGGIAFAVGIYGLTGVELSFIAIFVIMFGLYILAETMAKRKHQKQ